MAEVKSVIDSCQTSYREFIEKVVKINLSKKQTNKEEDSNCSPERLLVLFLSRHHGKGQRKIRKAFPVDNRYWT